MFKFHFSPSVFRSFLQSGSVGLFCPAGLCSGLWRHTDSAASKQFGDDRAFQAEDSASVHGDQAKSQSQEQHFEQLQICWERVSGAAATKKCAGTTKSNKVKHRERSIKVLCCMVTLHRRFGVTGCEHQALWSCYQCSLKNVIRNNNRRRQNTLEK